MAHVWHPVISRDPRHSPPSGHPATLSKAEHPGRRGLTAARALPPLMQLPASLAEEVADPVTGGKLADLGQLTSGINPTQIILLLSPLLLYGTFYLYREKFDRKAKVRQGQQVGLLGPTTAHPRRCPRVQLRPPPLTNSNSPPPTRRLATSCSSSRHLPLPGTSSASWCSRSDSSEQPATLTAKMCSDIPRPTAAPPFARQHVKSQLCMAGPRHET